MNLKFHLKTATHFAQEGEYRIIRIFDRDRVLVEVSPPYSMPRQLTVLKLTDGKVVL